MSAAAVEHPGNLAYCVEHGCPISAATMEVYNKNKAATEALAAEYRRQIELAAQHEYEDADDDSVAYAAYHIFFGNGLIGQAVRSSFHSSYGQASNGSVSVVSGGDDDGEGSEGSNDDEGGEEGEEGADEGSDDDFASDELPNY